MSAEQIAAAIGFFILVSGALWGIWWRIEGRVKEAKSEVAGRASTAQATATMAREGLIAYCTHVAETYVWKQGHREATEQIMKRLTLSKRGTMARISALIECGKPNRRSLAAPPSLSPRFRKVAGLFCLWCLPSAHSCGATPVATMPL